MDPVQLSPGVELRELQPDDADAVYALIDAERNRLGEALLRDSCKVGDRYEDVYVYGLLASEWSASP